MLELRSDEISRSECKVLEVIRANRLDISSILRSLILKNGHTTHKELRYLGSVSKQSSLKGEKVKSKSYTCTYGNSTVIDRATWYTYWGQIMIETSNVHLWGILETDTSNEIGMHYTYGVEQQHTYTYWQNRATRTHL